MREMVFPLVSLGSDAEANPDTAEVSQWISTIRGRAADLLSYHLSSSLSAQRPFVSEATAGGMFYEPRVLSMLGAEGSTLTNEPALEFSEIHADLAMVKVKGCGFSLPAFSSLGLKDGYCSDADEFEAAGVEAYTRLSRELRDHGATKTILWSECPGEIELEAFSGKRFLWVTPAKEFERVLERSRDLVIRSEDVVFLAELCESYTLRNVFVLDGDANSVSRVLEVFDPEYVFMAGYAPGENREAYWKERSAVTVRVGEE